MHFFDIIQLSGTISSSIMAIFGAVGLYYGYKTKIKGGIRIVVRDMVGVDDILTEIRDSRDLNSEHSESLEKVQDALRCVLRKEIKEICDKCLDKGYVTNEELEILIKHNESYEKLNGNSFIHSLVDRVRLLPMGNEE